MKTALRPAMEMKVMHKSLIKHGVNISAVKIFLLLFVVIGILGFNSNLYAVDYTIYSKRSGYLELLGKTIPSDYVQTIAPDLDSPDSVFIGTNDGMVRYNGKMFRTYGSDTGMYKEGPVGKSINSIVSGTNEIWIATDTGFSRLNKITGMWQHFTSTEKFKMPTDMIQCMHYMPPVLYLGTWGEGVVAFDTKLLKIKNYGTKDGIDAKYISSIARDDLNGVFWVGTYDRGLYSFSGENFKNYNSKYSDLNTDKINCLAFSSGKLYIGTPQGLVIFDGSKFKTYTQKNGLPSDVILCLKIDGFDVFVGTDNGLCKITGENITHISVTNPVAGKKPLRITCIETLKDKIYAGTQHFGLIEINK